MAIDQDPYRTLGLSRGASIDEIKRAYRRLAKIHHPDAAGEKNVPRFLAIQAAYEQLAGGLEGRTGPRRPGAAPRQPWEASPDRTDATRRAYGGRTRGPAPGPSKGTGGAASNGSAARGSGPGPTPGPTPGAAPGASAQGRSAGTSGVDAVGPSRCWHDRERPGGFRRTPATARVRARAHLRRRHAARASASGTRRLSAPPRTTVSRVRSSPTGVARAGTARPAAPTGRSTPRNTPTRASTAPNTRRAPGDRRGPERPTRPTPAWRPTARPPMNRPSGARRPQRHRKGRPVRPTRPLRGGNPRPVRPAPRPTRRPLLQPPAPLGL